MKRLQHLFGPYIAPSSRLKEDVFFFWGGGELSSSSVGSSESHLKPQQDLGSDASVDRPLPWRADDRSRAPVCTPILY